MTNPSAFLESFDDADDSESRRSKAIESGTHPSAERASDREAFDAFFLAITTVLESRDASSIRLNLTQADGRGTLQNAGRDKVIFYLNDGFLIVKIPPLPSPGVFPYIANEINGRILNRYRFSLGQKTMSELETAKEIVALAG